MDRVLGAVDLLPTVLGLLGVEGPREVQGADASGFATGGARAHCGDLSHWERAGVKVRHAWDDAAFFHHSHFDLAGVFTPDYELALWHSGEGALFSRRNDPEQLRNLFDEEYIRVLGINSVLLENSIFILIALGIVIMIKVVGIILSIALLTIPPATAKLITKDLKHMMLLSSGIGMIYNIGGLVISYYLNIPSGATIILFSSMCYFILMMFKKR